MAAKRKVPVTASDDEAEEYRRHQTAARDNVIHALQEIESRHPILYSRTNLCSLEEKQIAAFKMTQLRSIVNHFGVKADGRTKIAKRGRWCKQYQPTRPRVRPAVYEGTTSWEDYEAQFEMVADLNDWNSEEKAAYLAVSLVGQARTVLGDLSGEERRNFKSLTAALATRFGTENKTEMFRVNVKNRQREKDESLPELAQAIRRLTRQAYPSAAVDLRDILARDYFLDAITETDMRWKIRQARPKSLNEALGVAVELEAFMSAEKQRQRSARAAQVTTNSAENDKTKKTNDGLREEIEELKRLVQGLCSVQQNHQRFRGDGCWACGDKNHLRRDCPKRAQTTKQQVNSPLSGNDSLPSSRA
ncbi:hypothetical protein QZH41_004888 [Actinostola sp. cb2023]|nr:hypothetical protein QZH41_004888 [Actinostola sp. cb2023]